MAHEEPTAEVAHKCCSACHVDKPVAEFHRARRNKSGYAYECKSCSKARTYAYRAANPHKHAEIQARYRAENAEAQREANRRWVEAHPEYERARYKRRRADAEQLATLRATNARIGRERRAAIAASEGVPADVVAALLEQPCAYCWAPASELDHVVPFSAGGRHDIDNVVPACRSCNARKANKSLLLFLLAQRRRVERGLAHGAH